MSLFSKSHGKSLRLNALAAAVAVGLAGTAVAANKSTDSTFVPIASFDVMAGNGSAVAEIVDVSGNGKQLVYTDGENEAIGFVDISNPAQPLAAGTVAVGGEPTSLVVFGRYALVAVNTSESFTNPSGKLVVVNRQTRAVVAEHLLDGQPDSVALSPDQRYLAIVIENERDEDENGGLIPQYPSGGLKIVRIHGQPTTWTITDADLSPVAANAPAGSDLEPEYVDINQRNEAVVSFQENNHFAIVDLTSGRTLNEFSAGSVELNNVDSAEEDLISLDSQLNKRREPDAVSWIDNNRFASANEGDFEDANGDEGGSRGFTIFNKSGVVEFESAESFEHLLVAAGHYNEGRSENKGVEPESVEFGKFGSRQLLFVGSERSNMVGVYDVDGVEPELVQLLPTGIGPEGLKAIPSKGLFVASTETDEAGAGIPTMINIFEMQRGDAYYPMIVSDNDINGLPIPWVALSGLAADSVDANTLYAVSDSFLAKGYIYTVDASAHPARITSRQEVTGASSSLDLEGIAVGADGDFWVASEGKPGTRPNAILKVDRATGMVTEEILLPAELEDNARSNGFEGIAVTGDAGAEQVYVAIQRAWPAEGDDDGVNTKIARYDVSSGEWGFVHYPMEAEGQGGWIGLSELTALPDGRFAVVERDKGWGASTGLNAELKAVYAVDLANAAFDPYVDGVAPSAVLSKELLVDVLPALQANSIWTTEKLEGFTVAADGQVYVVTDNDGVDDAPGETLFLNLGNFNDLR
ncbi:esterase-like activity of phytase family protein [Marinobacter zhejiangensis]|uniref:Uncharacterized conserved protein n=1 Tax=Marinobacter zhejiangensis TaxID=488535 RepID=A0A1I4Q168_9GAMM|nr:esterase-like activity of phytase family protein [Marinobacter zhejiangensis]SFM33403.1 Uncharacterized conserved protein [Marinobacter zhejiangensis]